MRTTEIPEMQRLIQELNVAEGEETKALTLWKTLRLQAGQNCVSCSVGGLRLELTHAPRENGYMPKIVPGRQALLDLLQKEALDHLIGCRSKVEGINHQIRRLARG